MDDYNKFTKQEIIDAFEFDIKQYTRNYKYYLAIADGYFERIKEIKKKISEIREEMK